MLRVDVCCCRLWCVDVVVVAGVVFAVVTVVVAVVVAIVTAAVVYVDILSC